MKRHTAKAASGGAAFVPSRRHLLRLGGAAAASAALLGRGAAQGTPVAHIRIGTVFPSRTGTIGVVTSQTDYAGDGGRFGALLAETAIGQNTRRLGTEIEVVTASAPVVAAAVRAGQRLVETADICALIGGVGEGQAEALAEIAEQAGIPFFNVGSERHALRNSQCRRLTFHVEPSAAMYLDALAMHGAAQGYRRWFLVHLDTDEGRELGARAGGAIARHGGPGAEIVGSALPEPEQPIYLNELQAARRAAPDVILLLLNARDAIVFTGQQEDMRIEAAVLALPDTVSQTRDYIAAARGLAPAHNPRFRVASWEATLTDHGAGEFNGTYGSRWSEPTDPTGWASYHAVKILVETVLATGTTDADAIVAHLERPDTEFDLLKGTPCSFRPWDHQLRQPVYVVRIDQEAEWRRTVLANRIGIVQIAGTLPVVSGADAVAALDTLGDGPEQSACRF